jgi:DNA-binding NarL/FixJ family response regulator
MELFSAIDTRDEYVADSGTTDIARAFVALIEGRPFLRECIGRAMQAAFSVPVVSYATLSELDQHEAPEGNLVVVSMIGASREEWLPALKNLREIVPRYPVVTLSSTDDVDLARAAISHGARGYIPVTMDFEIAIEAIRFVLVGGTYAPIDYLLETNKLGVSSSKTFPAAGALTGREFSVVQALKQGKSNKVIANELNMCESTVKVHLRNVMKKLNAKNRTEVAMKA